MSGTTPSTTELLKKVRRIELKTKGLSNQIFSGEYHSAFKGRGMAFSEVREYMPGDEIRTIDWNVTARLGEPYVKVFEEERELTAMLLVDVSASDSFGSKEKLKRTLITELGAILSFSAIQNNDKIGVIFFTDKVELFIPPKKGKSHILRIIRELLEFHPTGTKTNIQEALRFLNRVIKKRCITFLLSDFQDDGNYLDTLKLTNRKHDLVAMQIFDPRELKLPNVGLVELVNPETRETMWVNTSNRETRNSFEILARKQLLKTQSELRKSGIDFATLATNQPYVKPLMNLFKKRG